MVSWFRWFVMERLASLCIVASWFLNVSRWCWIPDQSSWLSKYLLFIQEKYSWFTFYLGTIDFPWPVYSSHSVLKFWTVHRVSIWAHMLSLRTSNVILLSCWYLLNLTYYIVRICEYLIVSIFIRSKNRMVPEKLDSIRSNCWRDKEVEGPRSATKLHLSICDGRHKRKSKWHRYIPFM